MANKIICAYEGCGKSVHHLTAESCNNFPELEGKVYCKDHKNQLLKDKYACVRCLIKDPPEITIVKPEHREPSIARFGEVRCYSCSKVDKSIVPKAEETSTIAPEYRVIEPVITADEAIAIWKKFEALKRAILEDDDWIETITKDGKKEKYYRKSFWDKMSMFTNITEEIITKEIQENNAGYIQSAYYEVKASINNNTFHRSAIGGGYCDITERRFVRPGHDIRAQAHTRARLRAIQAMVGGSGIGGIAEEAEGYIEEDEEDQ